MISKPSTRDGYGIEQVASVHRTCLYMATKLGDLLDEIVVVGGLVPYLLIDQENLPSGLDPHVGTMDLDMGLAAAILNRERYRELGRRLRDAGFEPAVNDQGNKRLQTWTAGTPHPVTVDFLIPPVEERDKGGELRHFESDLAAIITPGLELAFKDRRGKSCLAAFLPVHGLPGKFRYAAQAPLPCSRHLPLGTGQKTRTPTIYSTYGAGLESPMLQRVWFPSSLTPTSRTHCP